MKRIATIVLLLFVLPVLAMNPAFLGSSRKKAASGGGGGGGTYALLGHSVFKVSTTGSTNLDCTGAALIVVSLSWFSGAGSVSSTPANTFIANAAHGDACDGIYSNQVFHVANPTGASSITISAAANIGVACVAWYSYSGTTPTLDSQNGFNHPCGNITSFNTGSAPPSGNNELVIGSAAWNDTGADTFISSVDSSFTIRDQQESGARSQFYGGLFDKIQTTGASENPLVSYGATINVVSASLLFFK